MIENMEPKIVFEDEDLLVLEKPAGRVVNKAETTKAGETVQEWVEKQFSIFNFQFSNDKESDFYKRAGIVHRLDKETSGLLLVAKTEEAFVDLQKQFKERKVEKRYLALVHGKVEPSEGEIKAPVGRLPWNRERFGVLPGGREAVTKYKVLRYYGWMDDGSCRSPAPRVSHSLTSGGPRVGLPDSRHPSPVLTLLELSPQTGRTHQIRVHLKYLGHPVVGDFAYAGRKQAREQRKWCPRVFLHAAFLRFAHPKSGKWLEFKSELPADLKKVLSQL